VDARRREDLLDVDRPEPGRFACVVHHDLAEVLVVLQRIRREDPDVAEVGEVAVVVELRDALFRVRGECVVVAAGDLEQGLRPHRPLEMDVQLDLRERSGATQ
jgi:hypothetical protein